MIKERVKKYKKLNPNELTAEQLDKLEKEISNMSCNDTISDEYCDFKLWCQGLPSRQEQFALFLSQKMKKTEHAKVLEVGCGRKAIMAKILSKEGFDMTCIDPKLELSKGTIKAIKEEFDYKKIDLSPYDYVVALEPCDATEGIIRACVKQEKPFFIGLCGAPHRLLSGDMPKDVYDWYGYLADIDNEKIKLRHIKLKALSFFVIKSNHF